MSPSGPLKRRRRTTSRQTKRRAWITLRRLLESKIVIAKRVNNRVRRWINEKKKGERGERGGKEAPRMANGGWLSAILLGSVCGISGCVA
jgi:hypothetical protein